MPLDGFKPYPKSGQLARKQKRYRRKVASTKQWQALRAEKDGPCRVCGDPPPSELHHLVARDVFGDDVADNLAPLCRQCHRSVEERERYACRLLVESLTDGEYAYCVDRGGEDFFERRYGLTYDRVRLLENQQDTA